MSENISDSVKISVPEDGLGERIKSLRESKKITHDGLSSLTKLCDVEKKGISRTTIRGYEIGTFKPGTREIRILSEALEVSPTYLILGIAQADDNIKSDDITDVTASNQFSLGQGIQTVWAFINLSDEDKQLVRQLIMSLNRHQLGEVEYRKFLGLTGDIADLVDDVIRDQREGNIIDFEPLKQNPLILDSIKELAKKYGFTLPPNFGVDT